MRYIRTTITLDECTWSMLEELKKVEDTPYSSQVIRKALKHYYGSVMRDKKQ